MFSCVYLNPIYFVNWKQENINKLFKLLIKVSILSYFAVTRFWKLKRTKRVCFVIHWQQTIQINNQYLLNKFFYIGIFVPNYFIWIHRKYFKSSKICLKKRFFFIADKCWNTSNFRKDLIKERYYLNSDSVFLKLCLNLYMYIK